VFGYDDAPHGHGEVLFENVRVPASNMLLGEGRGFEIAQGRLGPGRIHHCMRQIGVAERALELMCRRATRRIAFGKPLADNDITLERIAESRIERDGDHYVINGHKWWTSGIGDPRCKVLIFMGKTDPKNPDKYKQQSMILVTRDTPGIKVVRMLTVFGYDDAPHGHGEVLFENVRVPVGHMLLGEGRGFEIAQGRLGPGRIHHCMRQIGVAERALELMCKRSMSRVAFGKRIADHDVTLERIAEARIKIDQARLLVLHAAYMMDTVGNKAAKQAIAEIKVAVPNMTGQVVDWAMQVHGGGGVSQEFPLAFMWAHSRTLRFADGPDEVHRRQIGRLELRKHS